MSATASRHIDVLSTIVVVLVVLFAFTIIVLGSTFRDRDELRRENVELKNLLVGPAAKTVQLSNGARLKVVEVEGEWFAVAGISQQYTGTPCDLFILKGDGSRDYTERIECPR